MSKTNSLATIGTLLRVGDPKTKTTVEGQIGILIFKLMDQLKVKDSLNGSDVLEAVDYIVTDFKNLTIEDIGLAFRMIVNHGYGDIEYSFYNRFSIDYICRMLREYQKFKQTRNMEKPPLAILPNQKALVISPETSRKNLIFIAEQTYADLVNHNQFFLLNPNVEGVFDLMQKAGLANEFEMDSKMYLKRAELQALQEKLEPTGKKQTIRTNTISKIDAMMLGITFNIKEIEVEENVLIIAKKLYIHDKFIHWKNNKRERIFQ